MRFQQQFGHKIDSEVSGLEAQLAPRAYTPSKCMHAYTRNCHYVTHIMHKFQALFQGDMSLTPSLILFLVISCGPLSNPENGRVSVMNATLRAFYTCNHGYRLEGGASRTCQSSGRWSGVEPRCQGNFKSITHRASFEMGGGKMSLCQNLII